MLTKILFNPVVLGIVLAPVVFIILQGMKAAFGAVDRSPPWVKQVAAIALALILVGLQHLIPGFHVAACDDVAGTGISEACKAALANKDAITAILAGILPQLWHMAAALKGGGGSTAKLPPA